MKKYLVLSVFILLPFIFAGCLRTYYPAVYHFSPHPNVYQNVGSETAQYAGGDFAFGRGEYEGESLYLFRANYTGVNTYNHFNLNRRIFSYTGFYDVNGVEGYDGAKSFFGLGGEMSFTPNFKISSFKMGLGLSVGAVGEAGEYFDFVKTADQTGKIDGYENVVHFMISVFPAFSYEFSESTNLSAQINAGIPGVLSPIITLNNDNNVYWISVIPNFNRDEDTFANRIAAGFMINMNGFF